MSWIADDSIEEKRPFEMRLLYQKLYAKIPIQRGITIIVFKILKTHFKEWARRFTFYLTIPFVTFFENGLELGYGICSQTIGYDWFSIRMRESLTILKSIIRLLFSERIIQPFHPPKSWYYIKVVSEISRVLGLLFWSLHTLRICSKLKKNRFLKNINRPILRLILGG